MTQKTQFKLHLQTLEKIGTIMTAMRNLSFIEMSKASRFLITQDQIQSLINQMGNDFLTSYPECQWQIHNEKTELLVLIGSERGFCSSFNDNLTDYIKKNHPKQASPQIKYVIVGKKLAEKMGPDKRIIHQLEGPSTIEEISDIIFNLLDSLNLIFTNLNLKPGSWSIIFNKKKNNTIQTMTQHPYSELIRKSNGLPTSPHLNVPPKRLISEFMNQYLFYLFYTLFYQSFFAENYCRSNHLQSALEHLHRKVNRLKRKINLLRQEEITQEIQTIMLSVDILLNEAKDGYE